MAESKDKEIVYLNCTKCGTPITMKFGSYRKTKDQPHLCRSCRGKAESERINNLPLNEKTLYLTKKNAAIKAGWDKQSEEKKKLISDTRKDAWSNDPGRKERLKIQLKERWTNMPINKREELISSLLKGRSEYWSVVENILHHSELARNNWYRQSKEEQDRILESLRKGRNEYLSNMSDEEKRIKSEKQSEGLVKYWSNISPENRKERIRKFAIGLKNHFDNLDIVPNNNEESFINILSSSGIPYEFIYVSKEEHPDFTRLFPINPVKKGASISPYHSWDFRIPCTSINSSILVDVDGSIHDPEKTKNKVTDWNGNQFILSDYIKFKDSQRPYQTDGLDAYVIQCYDDTLTINSPVIDIKTGETMTVDGLLGIIMWLNMSPEDQTEIIRLI